MSVFRQPVTMMIVSVTSFLTLGCSWFSDQESPFPGVFAERTDAQIFVGDTIEMNYDPNVIMKRAESFHEKEGYTEAIVEYQHFLDMHPKHVLAPYAQYRLALSHFKMIQTIDRDMTPVNEAEDAFQKLLATYPANQYEAEARVKIKECQRYLAQHHSFVGTFYYKKEHYLAAAKRFEKIIYDYPTMEEAVEAKLFLAKSYQKLGALEWARDWATALVQEHPRHRLRKDGNELLAALQDENPTLMAAQPRRSLNRPTSQPGLFPRTTASRNPRSPLPPTASTLTNCQVGSWCGGTGMANTFANPRPRSVPRSVTCRPGTWCE